MPTDTNGKVLLRMPRGFCAGVVRAVDIVELARAPMALRLRTTKLYTIRTLSNSWRCGAIFVESIEGCAARRGAGVQRPRCATTGA
jgi:hypothetical protein